MPWKPSARMSAGTVVRSTKDLVQDLSANRADQSSTKRSRFSAVASGESGGLSQLASRTAAAVAATGAGAAAAVAAFPRDPTNAVLAMTTATAQDLNRT